MGRLPREVLMDVFERYRRHPSVGVLFDIPPAFLPPGALLRQGARSCRLLNILGILPDGSMAMCGIGTAVPGLVYGRLPYDRVEDVWNRSPGLQELRRLIPVGLQEPCAGCAHRDACLGVCAAGNYHRTGRLDAPFWFCEEAHRAGEFPVSRVTGSGAVSGG
jgi:radical SAM protein with 4Fe4S-binding SPASM domain